MFRIENCAAVIIDVQNRLAEVMHEKDAMIQQITRLVKGLNALNIPILCTEQLPEKLGPTVPAISELLANYAPITKSAFSCCGAPGFVQALEQLDRKNIVLCGIESHVCVFQTAADLTDQGFNVQVVADATSSRTPTNRETGLGRMRRLNVDISSVESCLFELMGDAQHTAFKAVLNAVK